ncbi:hypothetical protein NKG05_07115 [Oerskovia sp. M15]
MGTGHRAQMYVDAIAGPHADVGSVVAWCEPNPVRAAYYDAVVGDELPRYERRTSSAWCSSSGWTPSW